ncbi:MAG TPA: hypothetical protein VIE64_04070 [Solirubrobacterales bacterium]|jgi:hypothetical protein
MLIATTAIGVGVAHGERVKRGDLLLSFNASFTPHALPRDRPAPVTVDLAGAVNTSSGVQPPQLRSIALDVNRYGRLNTRGLPTCQRGQLESTSTAVALDRCRGALVGHGLFKARVDFPNFDSFPVEGGMLAFNSRAQGRPTILMHVYGSNPVEATVVLTFKVTHNKRGTFGTTLFARIPKIASDLGYVTNIELSFGRKYLHNGKLQSFISARCAAPDGFLGAIFPLARGTFTFANDQRLTITLTRECDVR